jgi:sugar-specific transcriptional regulator TrmB
LSAKIDDLASRLHVLGLDEAERELYVQLLQLGPSKASSVACVVEISRSSVYRTPDALAEEGYVRRSPGRPTLYQPEDPEAVFEMELRELKTRLDRVEQTRRDVLGELEELGSKERRSRDGEH